MARNDKKPKHLGKISNSPTKILDLIPIKRQPSSNIAYWGDRGTVTIECSEFSSLCPVTGQPDFGKITIDYQPREYLVETKSLKLYIWSFRTQAAYNEAIVEEICSNFLEQVKPLYVRVCGEFNARGGIKVRPVFSLYFTDEDNKE